ncbi:MAG: Fic family protein [Rhizobium rhizophilum]
MQYIHEHPNWPAFTWDVERVAPVLAAVRHRQGRLLGRMEGLGFALRAEAGLLTLTEDVVTTSAIEGETLDRQEVRSSIARRLGIDAAGLVPANRDVDGIVEIMIDATRKYADRLTAERLFDWHAALFPTGRSGLHKITVAAWRTAEAGPMQVVSGPYGRETVHFEAPTADRLDCEMQRFLDWFETPDVVADPVIRAGLAHLWFVTIHPFEDGNGRIARAIADMALSRADGSPERFYSMSARIAAERQGYYRALERQQRADLDVTPWLDWFLGCLDRAMDDAEATLAAVLFKARFWSWVNREPVNVRQQTVLNRLLDGFVGPLTSSKYAKLTKCSLDTALRDIQALVARGVLIQNEAGGRSTSYRLAQSDEIAI